MYQEPEKLLVWLREAGLDPTGPLSISRVGIGQSNITCLVTDAAGVEWILREPPPGRKSATAHDVVREARIMRALASSPIPVPMVIGTGTGPGGHPFVVMNRVAGAALETEEDAAVLDPPMRRDVGIQVIDIFSALHRLKPADVGLEDLGPHTSYVERQVRRISEAWARTGAESRHHADWDRVRHVLGLDPPPPSPPAIVHGDYRLANLLVDEGSVRAVLDWELSTIGEPLADLAWLLDDWKSPSEPASTMPSPTRAGCFPDRAELLDRYTEHTGIDVTHIDYYRGFSQWRAASLLQGVQARRRSGSMGSHADLDLDSLDLSIERMFVSAQRHLESDHA